MARNNSLDTLEKRVINTILELKKQLEDLKKNQISPNGYVVFPAGTADPAGAPDGAMYFKTSTGKFRRKSGGTWADAF